MQFTSFNYIILFFSLSVYSQRRNLMLEDISFDIYPRYQDIQDYLRRLSRSHKHIVDVRICGISVEKRNITYIKISSGGLNRKPLIFIDAGIHAREWQGPVQALYIIHQLVENNTNSEYMRRVDWIIVPLVNPDGYEYSHNVDRLWRKNRAKGRSCGGVDLNRNFDFMWSLRGLGEYECSPNYAGTHPFSEPESLALSDLLWKYAHRIKVYITLHSAARLILYPWGYTKDLPTDNQTLYDLGLKLSNAVYRVNSTEYKVGSAAKLLFYLGPGTSRDWVYGVLNITYAYTIELKGIETSTLTHRFQVPEENILGIISEMFEGIKILWLHVDRKYGRFKF